MSREKIYQVSSYPHITGNGSSFVYTFREQLKQITEINLTSGIIPYITGNIAYYDIKEISTKTISGITRDFNGILRWDPNITLAANRISLLDVIDQENKVYLYNTIDSISTFTIKIYDETENLCNFGTDNLRIVSITPGSPSIITTLVNHGMVSNDYITIYGIDNMSSYNFNRIFNSRLQITSTGLTTFTVPIDTSAELALQYKTGTGTLYPLGSNGFVQGQTGKYNISLISAVVGGSQITLSCNHDISIGSSVVISGVDNCALPIDNIIINARHDVIGVPGANSFIINKVISAYITPSIMTGTEPPYLLGSKGVIKVEKRQVSLSFQIKTSGKTLLEVPKNNNTHSNLKGLLDY